MIYVQNGLVNNNIKPIKSDLSDFDYLMNYNPQSFSKASNAQLSNPDNKDIKHNKANYVFAGSFKELKRNDSNLLYRTLLFVDLDNTNKPYQSVIDILGKSDINKLSYIAYPTIKNGFTDNSRLRLVIDLDRNISKEEWQPLTELVGKIIGLEVDSNANNKWSQAHGLPLLTPHNTANMIIRHKGNKLHVDKLLSMYKPIHKAQLTTKTLTPTSNNSGNTWQKQNSQHLTELLNGLPEGERNNGLFVFIKHFLFITGGDSELVYELATMMNLQSHPPLQDIELNNTFISAYRSYKGGK
ncbi:primase alpha helix C-terminal domain-containing protein [Periweissella fabaria]|uniref:Primase C-terminal 1 domain-containing protein n=1 Tax=Periweissella fabaria TaxID=546157 RepID=A0ABM8Z6Y3_9LACO|nr:primase alpha helix C-terminal domain-containing protein [Periweissella fabaria]MCM0597722.1 primase alpha helix C-terminal domain-containing protein [Periweissella fabaria]CAH0417171.1 hypothetical protein WFA24289_01500 [Periweissella fabaria]